jgi:hypothetical protein
MLIGLIALYLFICGLLGAVGAQKKSGFLGIFLISVFLTPIGGVIALIISEQRRKSKLEAEALGEPWKVLNREAKSLERQNRWEEALNKYKKSLYELKKFNNITEARKEERKALIQRIEKRMSEVKQEIRIA